ncbi:hypothetical protein HT118_04105 [Escherichia coli]|nr:hypothetical protein [Escherichia coli]
MRLNGILLESVGCPLMTGQLCQHRKRQSHADRRAQAVGLIATSPT